MNNCIISGRLGADPVLSQAGVLDVCGFSIANQHGYGDKQKTYWISCVAWKHTAKYLCDYARKGDLLVCEGILTQKSFDTKEGKKVSRMNLTVNEIVIQNCKMWKRSEETKPVQEVAGEDMFSDDSSCPF